MTFHPKKFISLVFSRFKRDKSYSRLKKKLLLYFILVSVVSISVSAQIILEMSSSRFRNQIRDGYIESIAKDIGLEEASQLQNVSTDAIAIPVSQLRNRMLLMLIVVTASIFGAFSLFVRDIVVPMDGLVEATKKIASGDLNAHAPVMSEDEIGQLAELINDMNINMQDLITQVRRELDNYNFEIAFAVAMIGQILENENTGDALKNKRLKLSEFKRIIELNKSVETVLDKMSDKLTSLHSFISTYTNYTISSEITQKEIDESLSHYR
ncbi:MAG: HAMP domain-containing protein [Spirochaetes bacterium]|jgi:methyl-accepting chemotaxis protein|nr:HAMP domain-containing protein [Spirochaetota bacterium]